MDLYFRLGVYRYAQLDALAVQGVFLLVDLYFHIQKSFLRKYFFTAFSVLRIMASFTILPCDEAEVVFQAGLLRFVDALEVERRKPGAFCQHNAEVHVIALDLVYINRDIAHKAVLPDLQNGVADAVAGYFDLIAHLQARYGDHGVFVQHCNARYFNTGYGILVGLT